MANIYLYTQGKDVSYGLINEIKNKSKTINSHPEYSSTLKKDIFNVLIDEANTHSFTMEIEDIENKGFEEDNYMDLKNSWQWAERNYDGNFTHDFLIELSGKIEPTLNYKQTMLTNGIGYRKDNVRVTGSSSVMPVKGTKVNEEMVSLVSFLNDPNEEPIVRAIFGHMHLARIHPFYDGNGRCSRMIQNLILSYNGFPAIRIEHGERIFYQRLLRGALRDFNYREEEQDYKNGNIKTFFEYLATTENVTLDRLENILREKRSYEIDLIGAKGKAQCISIEHKLKSAIKSQSSYGGIRVKLNKDKTALTVKGNISKKELKKAVKITNCKNKIKYKITPLIN